MGEQKLGQVCIGDTTDTVVALSLGEYTRRKTRWRLPRGLPPLLDGPT